MNRFDYMAGKKAISLFRRPEIHNGQIWRIVYVDENIRGEIHGFVVGSLIIIGPRNRAYKDHWNVSVQINFDFAFTADDIKKILENYNNLDARYDYSMAEKEIHRYAELVI